jgi:phenylacetic acid degradation operon negative regulatory protein
MNAVAAVNAPLACSAFVATYLPILAELRRDRHAEVAEEDAFLIRTLLIHHYRRLRLRDPELPDVLLPAEWPGQKARLLCKELYRRLAPASERHLDRCLVLADGTIPPPTRPSPTAFRRTTRWRRCRCSSPRVAFLASS